MADSNGDQTLVTIEQCRAVNSGCGDGDARAACGEEPIGSEGHHPRGVRRDYAQGPRRDRGAAGAGGGAGDHRHEAALLYALWGLLLLRFALPAAAGTNFRDARSFGSAAGPPAASPHRALLCPRQRGAGTFRPAR